MAEYREAIPADLICRVLKNRRNSWDNQTLNMTISAALIDEGTSSFQFVLFHERGTS